MKAKLITATDSTKKMHQVTVSYNGLSVAEVASVKKMPRLHVMQFYYPLDKEATFHTRLSKEYPEQLSRHLTAIFTVKPKTA